MTYDRISTLFYASLLIVLPIGLVAIVLWGLWIFPRIVRSGTPRSGRVSLNQISFAAVFWMTPGIVAMMVCSVPSIYLGHLLKQLDYCTEVVRVNGLERAADMLDERCSLYDRNELAERARTP